MGNGARALVCAAAISSAATGAACGSSGVIAQDHDGRPRSARPRAHPRTAGSGIDAGGALDASVSDAGSTDAGAPDAGDVEGIARDNESLEQNAPRRAVRVLNGRASYYADMFIGRRTANGEVYDARRLTAASRTLPFGTIVRVVREGRSVVVRVNDRGPFRDHTRLLDLSRAAAERLDMIERGVARVRLEILVVGRGRPGRPRRPRHRR